ncbi:MAG TPA: YXWGXW repeat-containing protein [Terriglobia bacterium]|nr:YXWGXW repeat-containing protein [Terriglobia bacterium]
MRNLIRTTVFAVLVLAGGAAFAGQVSIGVRIGAPPAPRVIRVRPASPGPDFVWIDGYWYPVGRHYRWHEGYWTRPPYAGYRWVAPRHDGEQYFAGYWDGDRGRVEHDHHWDRRRERDYGRDHDRDRDHDHH